jgi:hypothetical protein
MKMGEQENLDKLSFHVNMKNKICLREKSQRNCCLQEEE